MKDAGYKVKRKEKSESIHIRIESRTPDRRKEVAQRRTLMQTREIQGEMHIPVPEELKPGKIQFENLRKGLGYAELIVGKAQEACDLWASVKDQRYKFSVVLHSKDIEVSLDSNGDRFAFEVCASYIFSPSISGNVHFIRGSSIDQFCFLIPQDIIERAVQEKNVKPPKVLSDLLANSNNSHYY